MFKSASREQNTSLENLNNKTVNVETFIDK